jgi:hypothetical protein
MEAQAVRGTLPSERRKKKLLMAETNFSRTDVMIF